MAEWSSEVKELHAALKEWRISEACEGITQVLLKGDYKNQNTVIPKKSLWNKVVKQCKLNRRSSGVYTRPSIMNRDVKPVNFAFLESEWSDICEQLAEGEKFYVCAKSGRGGGIYKGTIVQYQMNQEPREKCLDGSAKRYNNRSDILNERGRPSPYINVLQLKSRNKDILEKA